MGSSPINCTRGLNFRSMLGEFLSAVGYVIYTVACYIFKTVGELVGRVIDELAIPMLPSRSKILDSTYVSSTLFLLFLAYVIYINIKTYSLFIKDKENAVERKYRIRESKLLRYCFLGGAFGGILGMEKARHKTKKPAFTITVRILLVIQLSLFSSVCGFFGFWIYMS